MNASHLVKEKLAGSIIFNSIEQLLRAFTLVDQLVQGFSS